MMTELIPAEGWLTLKNSVDAALVRGSRLVGLEDRAEFRGFLTEVQTYAQQSLASALRMQDDSLDFALCVALAVASDRSLWVAQENGEDLNRVLFSCRIPFENGWCPADPRFALEVVLLTLHDPRRSRFDPSSSGWKGVPVAARELMRRPILAAVEEVVRWLRDCLPAEQADLAFVPWEGLEACLPSRAGLIYWSLWDGLPALCPSCQDSLQRQTSVRGRRSADAPGPAGLKEEAQRRLKNCLRSHRLQNFCAVINEMSLGQFLRRAVTGGGGPVQASTLPYGMLLSLLQRHH